MSQVVSAESKRAALLVATLSSFLTPFAASSVNIALPTIGQQLAMDAVSLSWVAMAYSLASATFLVPLGKLADIHGRKKVFLYGMTVFTVASLCLGFATSQAMLIAFRVVQGIGSAMLFGTGVSILTSVYPAGERGKALGINVAAVYLGGSCGPFLGGLLTQYLGWRSVFFAYVPLCLVVIVSALLKLTGEWAGAKGERFDLVGSLVYSLTLLSTMYGFLMLPAASSLGLILVGVVGLVLFVWWETKVESPVLDVNVFRRSKVFVFSNLAALFSYSATMAPGFLLSLYLQYVKGLSPQAAGLVMVSQPLVQAVFSPLAGRLSDRIEPRIVASLGMMVTTVGLAWFVLLEAGTGMALIVANLVLLGFGFALFSSPNTNAIMSSVEKRFYGVASATLATMRLTGQMFSMGIATLIIGTYVGHVEIVPANYPLLVQSTKAAFVVFTVLCGAGVFASLTRGNVQAEAVAG